MPPKRLHSQLDAPTTPQSAPVTRETPRAPLTTRRRETIRSEDMEVINEMERLTDQQAVDAMNWDDAQGSGLDACPGEKGKEKEDDVYEFVPETDEETLRLPPKKRAKVSGKRLDDSNFRFAAKSIFATYPTCPVAKEHALEQIKEAVKVEVEEYIIAQEVHPVRTPTPHPLRRSSLPPPPYLTATEFMRNTEAQNKAHFANLNTFYQHALFSTSDYLYE